MFNGLKVKIMKKKVLFAAMALVALASCSSDEIASLSSPPESTITDPETSGAIVFSSASKGITRADITGAEAATKLGNKFVVSGYKGPQTTWNNATNKIVFDNYLVEYEENTAHVTESNTANWEYVGKMPIKHAADNGIVAQTIKYWDYSTNQYDFFAWSTGNKTAIYSGTPTAGNVLVSEIDCKTANTAAYTFSGEADDLKECYISDLVTVKKGSSSENNGVVPEGYGKTVSLKFRQLGTKVRIALYETIPGYSVKNVEFYSAAASDDASATAAKLFTTSANEIYKEGTYTVYFPTIDHPENVDNNQAHIAFSPSIGGGSNINQQTTIDWGVLNYTMAELGESSKEKIYLGRSSNTASFAGNAIDNYYVTYLPNQNGTNLNLRVNYTLESIDGSKEEIVVKGATAQIPLIYTQWKPGYAYTYLFKISDKTNGYTGAYDPTQPDNTTVNSDPAGLYPITFDAVVVDAEEDKTQETITTVSAPSITTYQKGSNVVNNNEYVAAAGEIFVTVNDGNAANTPDLANGKLVKLTASGDHSAALYTLPDDGKKYTEADVVAALQTQDDDAAANTIKGRNQLVLTEADFDLVNQIQYGVDGNTIDLTQLVGYTVGNTPNAMKFTANTSVSHTYAFVYTKTAATGDPTPKYQAKTIAHGDLVNGLYRYSLVAAPTAVADSHTGDVEEGVTYFNNNDASADAITAFVGQGVSNLYTRSASTPYVYTIASGYAQTGTTYYYTLDNGQTYKDAHNVAYAATGWMTGLYEETTPGSGSYTGTSDTAPQPGKAYYYKESETSYKYCVFLPQRTTGLYVIDKTEANITACGASDTAVTGMTYFDKYTQNNGVYYVKVIKVQ